MSQFVLDTALAPGMWVVVAVALVAGFARGLTGFGVGLIMMPVTATVLGPAVAVPLLALIDLPLAVWLARSVWRDIDRRELALLLIAALIGMPAGIAMLILVAAETVKTAAALVVLGFTFALVMGFRLRGRPSRARTAATGFASGVMEGAIALPGPPLILVWLAARLPGPRLRANTVIYFAGLTLLAIPAFAVAGLITAETLRAAAITFPVYGLGVIAGMRATGHVPEDLFRKIVLGLIVAGAVSSLVA